ncbi:hypothetical protein [Streptomyces sp. NPDC018059]|uniref:hypothetical protein n=1 Tax=Streptomyces sp. NPDC018059 TaxID=3365041 RepID=UPI0037A8227F
MSGEETAADTPLFWSEAGRTAVVVRCHLGHLAARETFEVVGGCPYCNHTPGERIAALQATRRANLQRPTRKADGNDRSCAAIIQEGTDIAQRAGAVQFTLGDLALEVAPLHESHSDELKSLSAFAEALGISAAALARYRRVAAAWPQEKRDSRTSWSTHAIFATHPDRFNLIKHPPTGPKAVWICRTARNAIKHGSA